VRTLVMVLRVVTLGEEDLLSLKDDSFEAKSKL